MSENTLPAFANAPRSNDSMSSRQMHVAPNDRPSTANVIFPVVPTSSSLAIMRGAFEGLVGVATPLPSVEEQRDALERPFDQAGNPVDKKVGLSEEAYSFHDVAETDGLSAGTASTQTYELHNESKSSFHIDSAEFFNYLTAIGGA